MPVKIFPESVGALIHWITFLTITEPTTVVHIVSTATTTTRRG